MALPTEDEWQGLQAVLARAQLAIARAKALSERSRSVGLGAQPAATAALASEEQTQQAAGDESPPLGEGAPAHRHRAHDAQESERWSASADNRWSYQSPRGESEGIAGTATGTTTARTPPQQEQEATGERVQQRSSVPQPSQSQPLETAYRLARSYSTSSSTATAPSAQRARPSPLSLLQQPAFSGAATSSVPDSPAAPPQGLSAGSSGAPADSPHRAAPLQRLLPPFKPASQRLAEHQQQHHQQQQQHAATSPSSPAPRDLLHSAVASASAPSGAGLPRPAAADEQQPLPSTATSTSSAAALWGASPSSNPLLLVARRLAQLQQQQSTTLTQLLCLRLEQLRLRQQQLTALQELLRVESEAVEGTPLQMSAVQQALSLLSQSLEDIQVASAAIQASVAEVAASHSHALAAARQDGAAAGGGGGGTTAADVAVVAATVSCADARAEDISRMARQLLGVLREYPRRRPAGQLQGAPLLATGGGGDGAAVPGTRTVLRGATEWELQALPTLLVPHATPPSTPAHDAPGFNPSTAATTPSTASDQSPSSPTAHPLLSEPCAICLSTFTAGEALKAMPCAHRFHGACLDPWLRIKACCPLCKLALPGATLHVPLDHLLPQHHLHAPSARPHAELLHGPAGPGADAGALGVAPAHVLASQQLMAGGGGGLGAAQARGGGGGEEEDASVQLEAVVEGLVEDVVSLVGRGGQELPPPGQ